MPQIDCPECGAVLPLTDEQIGRRIECGACGKVFLAGDDPPSPSRRGRERDEDRYEDDESEDDYRDPDDLPPIRPTSSAGNMATAGLVLGILGVTLSVGGLVFCCPYLGGLLGALGIVFGFLGRKSENRGLAVGGIATGSAALFITFVTTVVTIVIFATN